MISTSVTTRGRAVAVLLAGGAAVALTVTGGASASASPRAAVPPKCQIQHELYQQPVAAVIAHVEAPESESCGVGALTLRVYRNGIQVAGISGSTVALNYRYDCVTTAPTAWRTNWDPEVILNCG